MDIQYSSQINRFANNPTVKLSNNWKIFIICYFLLWRIIPLIFDSFFSSDANEILQTNDSLYIFLRLFFVLLTDLLSISPVLLSRFGRTQTGWLHPLVFPTVFLFVSEIIKSPTILLTPLLLPFTTSELITDYPLFRGWSNLNIIQVYAWESFCNFLSILFTYIGFIYINPKVRFLSHKKINQLQLTLKTIFIFLLICFSAFSIIQASGGIINHISRFSSGRFELRGDIGYLFALVDFAPYPIILLYLNQEKVIRSFYFRCLLIVSCVLQFIVSGSRGASVIPLLILTVAWIFKNKKIPAVKIISLSFILLLAIGVLGDIRKSSRGGVKDVDFSSVTDFNLIETLNTSVEDISSRKDSTLGVFAFVPDKVNFLQGQTYVGALTFFIPRSIWSDKPRGSGAHAGAMIWSGQDTAKNYNGASIPVSAVAEAYWNFNIFGIFVIFFLYGIYLRWIYNLFYKNSENLLVSLFYIVSLFLFRFPSTDSIVPYLQIMFLLIIFAFFVGLIPLFSKKYQSYTSIGIKNR